MNLLPLILTKRAGGRLETAALEAFVAAVSAGTAPDYQVSALLMAIYCRGMDTAETRDLTRAMADSGETHDWSALGRPTVDKHSTGGVGDKLSLILAPLVASLGAAVPMLSGRGLGFTGGTLDKLESIPGFATRLDGDAFRAQVAELGCAFIGQSDAIAPADRRLYALRDVTGTVESLPLIVSSILSKKIAAGPAGLVIDLKVGRGAFMKDAESARALGRALRETAAAFGRRCSVLYTHMDAPLGRAVGNAPEVREALDVLGGGGPGEIRELALVLAAEMLVLAGLGERATLLRRCAAALDDGSALERFLAVVRRQGGTLVPEREDWGLPPAGAVEILAAERAGRLRAPDAEAIGRLCVGLGAGRARAEDDVDPRAGVVFLKGWGEEVEAGEPLLRIEAGDAARVGAALAEARSLLDLDAASGTTRSSLLMALEDAEGERPLSGSEDYAAH